MKSFTITNSPKMCCLLYRVSKFCYGCCEYVENISDCHFGYNSLESQLVTSAAARRCEIIIVFIIIYLSWTLRLLDRASLQTIIYANAKSSVFREEHNRIQRNNRNLLMMDILMSETCWLHKKWNKITSNIKLVFYSSIVNRIQQQTKLTSSIIC